MEENNKFNTTSVLRPNQNKVNIKILSVRQWVRQWDDHKE